MLRTSQESPVMKPGSKTKDFADKVVLAKSAFFRYPPIPNRPINQSPSLYFFDSFWIKKD